MNVVPGSHAAGVLSPKSGGGLKGVGKVTPVPCHVPAGGVLLMPAAAARLFASRLAEGNRRVIHPEYATGGAAGQAAVACGGEMRRNDDASHGCPARPAEWIIPVESVRRRPALRGAPCKRRAPGSRGGSREGMAVRPLAVLPRPAW